MTERQEYYDAGQPADRLAEIKSDLAEEGFIDPSDQEWLVAEVDRLRDDLIIRDAYIQAIGADIDKALEIGKQILADREALLEQSKGLFESFEIDAETVEKAKERVRKNDLDLR
jgi:hypothetical protein